MQEALGFDVAQSTVSKYLKRGHRPPSQSWKTFLRNHAEAIAAIDICVVPTATFDRLFAFLVLGHGRRRLLWFEVTRHPTAEWLARQITEAFPWTSAPTYLIRDNDRAYGRAFTARIQVMGIRDRPITPRSPWQNDVAERLIGTLRRECLDHIIVFGEAHLRRILSTYAHITIRRARTWHYRRMHRCNGRSSGLAGSPPFLSWPGCIINMSGYDFRKGQGRTETRTMDKAKRARTAETLKQPSPGLKSRAPYLYPDRQFPHHQPKGFSGCGVNGVYHRQTGNHVQIKPLPISN